MLRMTPELVHGPARPSGMPAMRLLGVELHVIVCGLLAFEEWHMTVVRLSALGSTSPPLSGLARITLPKLGAQGFAAPAERPARLPQAGAEKQGAPGWSTW
jgi:hypothetical protein